jgi:hypothetical protein
MPDDLLGHAFAPSSPALLTRLNSFSLLIPRSGKPVTKHLSDPVRQRDCPNMAGFADQIHDGPVLFSLLELVEGQINDLMPSEPAEQPGERDRACL